MLRSLLGHVASSFSTTVTPKEFSRSRGACFESLESRTLLAAWYVSTAGVDSNSGTLQQPLRSIQRAANLAQPGDAVIIRGGIYRETVIPARSGSASAPIVFQPYNGEQVTISGADPVQGWSAAGNSVYRANMPWSRGTGDDQVFVDGQMMIYARWPNTTLDVSRPIKLVADSASGTTTNNVTSGRVTDTELTQAAGYWNGATIHIATGPGFVQHTATVTASAPGSVSFTYSASNTLLPQAGNHFFLDNTFKALDAAGEWYRDPTTGSLNLRTPQSDNPSNHLIEAKRRDLAFDLRDRAYINVTGIDLFAATITTNAASHHLTIDGIRAQYVSHYNLVPGNAWVTASSDTGIILNGSFNEIRNSEIAFSAGNGVMLGGSDNRAVNNVIHDVNYAATDAAGINTGAPATISRRPEIGNNTIYNAGRSLIVFRNVKAGRIHHNDVYNAGLQTNDLGGVYTYGNDGEGTEVAYNTVHDIYSSVPGVGGFGIYYDNNTANFITHHNLVYNVGTALLINSPGINHQVYNNTLLGGKAVGSWPGDPLPGTVLKNNIFGGAVQMHGTTLQQSNLPGESDPLFVNPRSFDFRLQAISTAIDAGRSLAPYTDGFLGSAPDLGAFEYGVPAWKSGPTGANVPPPPLAAPTNASATALSDTQVRLTWTDNTTSEQGFTIERTTDGALFTVAGVVGSNVNSFIDRNLSPAVRYSYRVRADNSAYSNFAVAATMRGATSSIQAKRLDASAGVYNDGFALGSLDDKDWALFREINFGAGVSEFGAHIGVPHELAGKRIEIRIDGLSGPLVGTLTVAGTGGWSQMTTQWTRLSTSVAGWHDVYLVFRDGWGVGYLDSFVFKRSAPAALHAENYDDMDGIAKDARGIGSLDGGDWARYSNIDFGNGDATEFVARIGVPDEYAGKQIEVRAGSTSGLLVATLTVASTGGFGMLSDQSATMVSRLSGINDIYLLFKGGWGVGYLDSFAFKQSILPTVQAESYSDMRGIANDTRGIGSLDHGDWTRYGNVDFGNGDATRFVARVGVPAEHAGGQIAVRIGSTSGPLVATLTVASTGGFMSLTEQSAAMTATFSGLQDVYLVFENGWGVGYLDWFKFA